MSILGKHRVIRNDIEDALKAFEIKPLVIDGVKVDVNLELVEYNITKGPDEENFIGEVTYMINTEYGGGPIRNEFKFAVLKAKLGVHSKRENFDLSKELDIKEIKRNVKLGKVTVEYDEEDEA